MAARRLIFERTIGIHLRAAELAERRREAKLVADYAKSVEILKRQQQV